MIDTKYSLSRSSNNSVSPRADNLSDARSYVRTRTYSGQMITLWPPVDGGGRITARDIANHLGMTTYFPENDKGPFTAAQYAAELAGALKHAGPLIQLYGLLINAHEAYLDYRSNSARKAEKAMVPPPLVTDRRDELEDSMHMRILVALNIPEPPASARPFGNAILYARERLHATLERDLGAWFEWSDAGRPKPLPQKIKPKNWDRTIDRYLNLYSELTALCGVRVED